jgi:hypothetical protein
MKRRLMHIEFWLENQKGRSEHRWDDNIKMDLKDKGWGDID